MRKIIVLVLAALLISGCTWFKEKEKPAIKIGRVKISPEEFQMEFELSNFAKSGKKKEFLDLFISRKLILLEAEKLGLDKDREFLRDVQDFWEQSLLKITLGRKMKELISGINISEGEVKSYYEENKDDFADKEFEQAYAQIKWMLLRDKQKDEVQNWVDSLKKDTEVSIDYKLLGVE